MRKAITLVATVAMVLALWTPSHADSPTKRFARLRGTHDGVSNPEEDGKGRAMLKVHQSHQRLCYRVTFRNMSVFHVDIRRNRDHKVVTELYHDEPVNDPIVGCKGSLTRQELRALRKHPKRFFVYAAEYNALGQPPSEISGTLRKPT